MKRTILLLSLLLMVTVTYAQKKKPVHRKTSTHAVKGGLAARIAAGKEVYTKYCLTCHQADGYGVPNMNPPLIRTEYVLGDKARIIKIVLNGFKDDVEINGNTYSNTMPAFDYLKDEEVANVLTYVRNNFTNKASAVKVSEVAPIRAALKKK